MVVQTEARESCSPSSTTPPSKKYLKQGCDRIQSLKERHPKFRKNYFADYSTEPNLPNSTTSPTPPPPPYQEAMDIASRLSPPSHSALLYSYHQLLLAHQQQQQQQLQQQEPEEGPLDMSIKKRPRSSSPPPPYHIAPLLNLTTPNPPPPPYFAPRQVSPPAMGQGFRPPPSYEATTQFLHRGPGLSPPLPRPQPQDSSPQDTRPVREITIITDSSADPLLDEHFRRSLGANYQSLFKKNAPRVTSSVKSPPLSPDSTNRHPVVRAFNDDMETEGSTVEDHFAKALGDTWVRLQAEQSKKSKSTDTKPQLMAL